MRKEKGAAQKGSGTGFCLTDFQDLLNAKDLREKEKEERGKGMNSAKCGGEVCPASEGAWDCPGEGGKR